jgi:hypothetical protein
MLRLEPVPISGNDSSKTPAPPTLGITLNHGGVRQLMCDSTQAQGERAPS